MIAPDAALGKRLTAGTTTPDERAAKFLRHHGFVN